VAQRRGEDGGVARGWRQIAFGAERIERKERERERGREKEADGGLSLD
jgi:hypothetical protein